MRFYCTLTGPIGVFNCEVLLYFNWSGPIGGLNCEVLLYFNWSHRWSCMTVAKGTMLKVQGDLHSGCYCVL